MNVVREGALDSDTPVIVTAGTIGIIQPNLSIGAELSLAQPLQSNAGVCSNGMKPLGAGFIVSASEIAMLGLDRREGWSDIIRPYVNGRDLTAKPRNIYAMDLFGFNEADARNRYPEAYQHLLATVQPERAASALKSGTLDAKGDAEAWWLFCRPRPEMRDFLQGLERYVVTVQTAKHRVFQFLPASIMPDQKLMVIGFSDAYSLGVLSSNIHRIWTISSGGWLGIGNDSVYSKGKTFDPFPFPDPTPIQRAVIADLGEELDATRKVALAEHPRLTMTGLYNLVEKLRAGAVLSAAEETDARDARARIVVRLHEQLDAAVADAYGWGEDWARDILTPAEIVMRLVALNAERAAEEAAGHVRWLRPDYQVPRFGGGAGATPAPSPAS